MRLDYLSNAFQINTLTFGWTSILYFYFVVESARLTSSVMMHDHQIILIIVETRLNVELVITVVILVNIQLLLVFWWSDKIFYLQEWNPWSDKIFGVLCSSFAEWGSWHSQFIAIFVCQAGMLAWWRFLKGYTEKCSIFFTKIIATITGCRMTKAVFCASSNASLGRGS